MTHLPFRYANIRLILTDVFTMTLLHLGQVMTPITGVSVIRHKGYASGLLVHVVNLVTQPSSPFA